MGGTIRHRSWLMCNRPPASRWRRGWRGTLCAALLLPFWCMDPLSEVLTLLRPTHTRTAALDVAGPWSLRFPNRQGIKFCAVERGECWISAEGGQQLQHLQQGDCFLLSKAGSYVLCSDPQLAPVDAASVLDLEATGRRTLHGGGDHLIVSGSFRFADTDAVRVLDPLPGIVQVSHGDSEAILLRRALARLAEELVQPRPGAALVVEHLAHLMLVEMLRLFLSSEHPALPPGWMQAMTDPRIADSIRAMHGEPARTWRLDDLASIAAMSRTVYAGRFKQLMGVSPIEYLTNWRMLLAASRLRSTQQTLARIAADVGYSSEFSFIAAFTRVMDVAPGRYRRQVRTSIDAD